jgi:peptide/nickel transport system substrate-binding protein
MEQRRPQLAAQAAAMFGNIERPTLRIALPDAPGAHLLLNRIAADWSQLGIKVEASGPGKPADLALIDAVAPSSSPAWFLRHFRCGEVPVCDQQLGELLEGARTATVPAQRYIMLAQAAERIDEQQLFLAIAAPIRWSLVSGTVPGFAANRVARHTLTGLRERLMRERNE